MAKQNKSQSTRPDPREALEKMERPQVRWKVIAQIGVAFAVVWVLAGASVPYIGYWGVGVAAVLTAVALGFGIYIWRLTRKSARIVDILKTATDEKGRKAALERLESGDPKDALNALARAQLVAQDDPNQAVAILEAVDLKKAPAVVQDDVRANLGLLYLMQNKTREARALADELRLDRQPQAKAKAMYAAVMAESFARTGKEDEAKKLLETYSPGDPEYGEVAPLLLRAQVYAYTATKNRGLARKAMESLAAIDPNMLAPFVRKGTNPELFKMAKQLLEASGSLRPKMRMKYR